MMETRYRPQGRLLHPTRGSLRPYPQPTSGRLWSTYPPTLAELLAFRAIGKRLDQIRSTPRRPLRPLLLPRPRSRLFSAHLRRPLARVALGSAKKAERSRTRSHGWLKG